MAPRACLAAFLSFLVMLAGCGRSQFAPATQSSVGERARLAATGDLLYVSDVGTNEVDVYSYPGGSLTGTLKGFATPLAECADVHGNVFIVNADKNDVLEYAHGGQKPIAVLKDGTQVPQDCAVDRVTGDLAVTNYSLSGSNVGSIAIYKQAKGTPKVLKDSNVLQYLYCTYDGQGNLFVDGLDYSFNFVVIELPKGAAKFVRITVNQHFTGWGGVQWDGKDLAIGNGATTIYRFSISGQKATRVGVTQLKHASNAVQFWIQGSTVIGADGPNGGKHDVGLWKYPAGGNPVKALTRGLKNPSGVTVSVAP